jgi:hypothetical protein
MKSLVTSTFLCFCIPYLFSSSLALGHTTQYTMNMRMQKWRRLYQCINFEAIKPTNLNNGYNIASF